MSGYASGGYIPLAASMPVHLDDDECVVHHDQDGWHCARVLHQGYPCQSPTPTQDQPASTTHGSDTTTSGTGGQGQAGQSRTPPHPPLPHPAAPPPTTPAHGQGVGIGRATGNTSLPQPPHTHTT